MTRIRTGELASEISVGSRGRDGAVRFSTSSNWMPMWASPWQARLLTHALPTPIGPVNTRASSPLIVDR